MQHVLRHAFGLLYVHVRQGQRPRTTSASINATAG